MTEVQARVPMMIKVAFALMIVGLINALVALGITCYLNTRRPIDPSALQVWSRVAIWIWPSGIMMMVGDFHSSTTSQIIVGVLSVTANACLYGMVGLAIGAVCQKLTPAKR